MPTSEQLEAEKLRIEAKKAKETARNNKFNNVIDAVDTVTGIMKPKISGKPSSIINNKKTILNMLVPKTKVSGKLNDPAFYLTPDPDVNVLIEKLGFSDPLGLTVHNSHAGTCVIEWIPTLGPIYTKASSSAWEIKNLKTSLEEGFKVLRANNVSTSAFSRGEYALYHHGKAFIALNIFEAIRLIAITNLEVDKMNRNEPFGVVEALGYNYDDLVYNKYNYVSRLNGIIKKFNSYADMPVSNILKRWMLLATSLIKDHADSKKAQYYVYQSQMSYILDSTNGALQPIITNQFGTIGSGDPGLLVRKPLYQLLNIIDNQLEAFSESQSVSTISGNIDRAVGTNGFTIDEIPNDGDDILPNVITHDEVLCQIQNTEFITPHSNFYANISNSGSWGIQVDSTGNTLVYPKGREVKTNYNYNGPYGLGYVVSRSNNLTLNLFSADDLDPDEKFAIRPRNSEFYRTRHTIVSDYLSIPTKESSVVITRNKYILSTQLESCDSIVCIGKRFAVWSNPVYTLSSTAEIPFVVLDRRSTYTDVNVDDTTATPGQLVGSLNYLDKVMDQFDWKPFCRLILDNGSYIATSLEQLDHTTYSGELDTFTYPTREAIDGLNEACMINELAIQDLPKTNNKIG